MLHSGQWKWIWDWITEVLNEIIAFSEFDEIKVEFK